MPTQPAFNTLGSNRDELLQLHIDQRDDLIADNVLVIDPRRQRPRWFDGRFLAARDLANEQNYFLVRQADLGRAGGFGVVEGLQVDLIQDPKTKIQKLQIRAGHGVADSGELIVLRQNLSFDPTNVPEIQRLDGAFGLQVIPNEPGRTRTGLYVVALRAVEWTANPIAAYPTSLTGERKVEDGDIIEGIAVTLIPYPSIGDADWNRRRAQVAREIFVAGRNWGQLSGTLPLAMVWLRGNLPEWVDGHLVRRDAGAGRSVGMDFGFGARALREAHLLQYTEHLTAALQAANNQPFAAIQWFDTLPAAGRMPVNTINLPELTQRFFPPGISVELGFAPDDEIPALIEESLLLPPIDLVSGPESLEGIGVIVLAALPRAQWNMMRTKLMGRSLQLRSAQLVKFSRVMEAKTTLAISRQATIAAGNIFRDPLEEWRGVVREAARTPLLWYVRRRNLPETSNVAGIPVDATEAEIYNKVAKTIEGDETAKKAVAVVNTMNPREAETVKRWLTDKKFADNPPLLKSLLAKIPQPDPKEPPSTDAIIEALSPATDPDLGKGLDRFDDPKLNKLLNSDKIANSGILVDVDRLARAVPKENLKALTDGLNDAAKHEKLDIAAVTKLRKELVK